MEDLVITRIIKANERFESSEASLGGQKVFAKQAKSAETAETLKMQAANAEIINQFQPIPHIPGLRAPDIVASPPGWLITEWIEGEPLSKNFEAQPALVADQVARLLWLFDQQPVLSTELGDIFTAEGLRGRIDKHEDRLTPQQRGLIDEAANKLSGLAPMLERRLQDGDIKPDHLYADPQNPNCFVLIDSEHLGYGWPRLYDLANNISKFLVRGQTVYPQSLTAQFMRLAGVSPEQIVPSLKASLLVRYSAMLWSEDYEAGLSPLQPGAADKLLRLCLAAQSLDELLELGHS